MKKEDKDLLLKDLCARLPYKVIVEFVSYKDEEKPWIGELSCKDLDCFIHDVEFVEIKPYLYPLSIMTEEQEDEWYKLHIWPLLERVKAHTRKEDLMLNAKSLYIGLEWLNEHHFDYRGLIEKGLAIEAPEGMYN